MLDTKKSLRADMRRRRTAMAPDERATASAAACGRLLELPEVRSAAAVALYAALTDELDLMPAQPALRERGAAILLPRVDGADLELVAVTRSTVFAPGFRGVMEPAGAASRDLVDVIVVPGLAFDRDGRRLGQGGGHYDRLLARLGDEGTLRVGVGFDFQVVESVPAEAHDERVHVVVTDQRTVRT